MARDAEDTKRRIFEAATQEFADHGIAGARIDRIAASAGANKQLIYARIDRIAASAGANKQLIYAYFGSKRELFEAVVSAHVCRFIEEVPFDAADLPAYAGAAFDYFT